MITTRVQIGLTGIKFYAADGSTSSGILNDSNGNLNIIGSTGSFKEISGITGIFNNILTTKIGAGAGAISQGTHTVAFGNNAGNNTQGSSSVAIGNNAGSLLQGSSSVAIGNGAGASKQSQQSVAIGNNAGYSDQSQQSVAIGYNAGYSNQSQQSVAIGYGAGNTTQETRAVAIGYNAGSSLQASSSVAIGDGAGMYSQCENSVAIGSVAGYNYQGTGSIAIGNNAGSEQQKPQAIAIGVNAGNYLQGTGSIAIGLNAGLYNQGKNSIAIGNDAGPTGMSANTIILNASGTALYYTGPTGGFFVAPIQTTSVVGQNMILGYGPDKQIIGLTGDALAQFGIGSSTGTSSDPFLLTNFINPPSVPDSLSVTSSSSDIYVIYNYPKQTNFGIGLLPVISSLNIIVGNTGTSNFTGFTGTSSDFIKSTSTSNVVECINISKQGTEGIGNRNGKRMYTIRYPNLPNTDPNPNFYLWYANSSLSKSMYSTYLSYINSGLPSQPQPTSLGRPPPPTINSIPFMFKGSDKIDTVDPTSSADLRFNIYYAPLSNTKRYGGPVGVTGEYKNSLIGPSSTTISYNTSGNFFNVTGNTGLNYSGTITSAVYPETIYSVDVNASNSISSGFTGISLGNFTTQSLLPPTFVSSGNNLVSLSSGLISGKTVVGGVTVTNILPPNISSSFTQTFPIHNTTDSRGATGATPLVTFTSSVTGPAGTITGPSASYTGFGPSYVYGTSSAGNINMTLSTPTDVTGLAGYDGYYLRGNVTTAMSTTLTNGLVASATPYALSVTGTYSSNNSAVSANYYAPFYYDGQQTPAIIGTPSLSVVNGNTGMVCGVPVSKGSITLKLVTTVSGLGNNFVNNGNILNYAPSTGTLTPSSETSLSLVNLSGTISSGTFTNSALSLSLPSFLKLTGLSSLKITTTATNLYGTSTSGVQSNGVNILYDQTSFTLANTTFISTTALLNTYTSCYRLLSTSNPAGCFAIPPNNTPSNYLYNDISYSDNNYASTTFNNTRSIKDDTDYKYDLIISNGLCTSDPNYYIDYSVYGGPNYSTLGNIDTTRYATFAWKVDTGTISSSGTAYNFINFKLGNTSSTLFSSNGSVYTSSSTPSNSKFLLYYRLEDTANLNSTGSGWTNLTSPWIDGNAFDSSGTMYPGPGANTTQTSSILKGLSAAFTTNSTTTVFKVKIPNPISNTSVSSSTNLYIYCRVGLNMLYSFSFNNIQAQLSTL